jgi:hypothetical protein
MVKRERKTKATAAASPAPVGAVPVGSLERYEVVEVHRSELKNAPYNPRILTEERRKRLRDGLLKIGLLHPLVWNARTGYIVGGHQRIKLLDAAYGTADYRMRVARVELSDAEEREANLLLNNAEAQGDWDLEKLEEMLREAPEMRIEATGFTTADIYRLLGDSPFAERIDALDELAEKVREARDKYESIARGNKDRDSPDYFLVFVFRDAAECSALIQRAGWPDNMWQDGRQIAALFAPAEEPAA